jgi:hypothetical protein
MSAGGYNRIKIETRLKLKLMLQSDVVKSNIVLNGIEWDYYSKIDPFFT